MTTPKNEECQRCLKLFPGEEMWESSEGMLWWKKYHYLCRKCFGERFGIRKLSIICKDMDTGEVISENELRGDAD